MRRRILDLFKSKFSRRKSVKTKMNETEVPTVEKSNLFQPKKKPPSKWITRHNQSQAQRSNAVAKRRKKNKVARKQRKLNRAA